VLLGNVVHKGLRLHLRLDIVRLRPCFVEYWASHASSVVILVCLHRLAHDASKEGVVDARGGA
jgi:hypothetical protein